MADITSTAQKVKKPGMDPEIGGALIEGGANLLSTLITIPLQLYAMDKQQEQVSEANNRYERQYNDEMRINQERYDYNRATSEKDRAYSRLQDRKGELRTFAADLQNYLNTDRSAGAFVANLWRK